MFHYLNNITKYIWKSNSASHCVKRVRIRSYSVPYFPAFGLRLQSKYRKIRTRITPNTDTFYPVSFTMINQ